MRELEVVQVETTNLCNGRCVFCPHSEFTEHGIMSDELYKKIVHDCMVVPTLKTFIPMGTGEPFCDPQIKSRIIYARQQLPGVAVKLFTNGSLLDETKLQWLAEVPNFELHISVNALKPETRQRLMGLDDLEHVLKMWSRARQLHVDVVAQMVAYPGVDQQELTQFQDAGGKIIRCANWAGQFGSSIETQRECNRLESHMFVLYTGQVALCCFDPFGAVDCGNLTHTSVQEAWNSSRRQEMTVWTTNLCRNCRK